METENIEAVKDVLEEQREKGDVQIPENTEANLEKSSGDPMSAKEENEENLVRGSLIPRWATLTGGALYGVTKSSMKLTGSALKEVKQRMQEQLEARQQLLANNQLEEQKAMDEEEIILMMERLKHADLPSERAGHLQSVADLTARQAQSGVWVAGDKLIQTVLDQVRDPPGGDSGNSIVQVGMQCLYNLIAVDQTSDISAIEKHIELFLEAKGVEALVPLLDSRFGLIRLDVVQTLRMVLSNSGAQLIRQVEEAVLDCPAGMQQIADLMMAPTEEVRNEALLLLAALTHNCSRPDLQNFLAFQEGFDHLFSIQNSEKDTIISLDCLQTICNVLRGNALTQKLFLAGNYLPKLVEILNLKGSDLEQGEDNKTICVSPIRRAQILLSLRLLHMLIGLEDEEEWQSWPVDKSFPKDRQDQLGQEQSLILALCKIGLSGDGMTTCEWSDKGVGTQERRQALTILSAMVLSHEANRVALSLLALGQELALTALVEMCSLPSVSYHERSTAEGLFWSFVYGNANWCEATLLAAAGKVEVDMNLLPDPPEDGNAIVVPTKPIDVSPEDQDSAGTSKAEVANEPPATPPPAPAEVEISQKPDSSWDLLSADMKSSKKKKKREKQQQASPLKAEPQEDSQHQQPAAAAPEDAPQESAKNENEKQAPLPEDGSQIAGTALIGAVGKGLWGSIKWAAKAVDEAVSAEYVKVQAQEELERTRNALDGKSDAASERNSPLKKNGKPGKLQEDSSEVAAEKAKRDQEDKENLARAQHAMTLQMMFACALYAPVASERGSSTAQLSALKLLRWVLQNTEAQVKQQMDSVILNEDRVLYCSDYRPPEIPAIQAAVYVLQQACWRAQKSCKKLEEAASSGFYYKYIHHLCCLLCVWIADSPSAVMSILRNGVNWQIFEIVSKILETAEKPGTDGSISQTSKFNKFTNALVIGYLGMLFDGIKAYREDGMQGQDAMVVSEHMFVSALQERMDIIILCDGLQSIEQFCLQHKEKSAAADLAFHNMIIAATRRTHGRFIELIANPSLAEDKVQPKMALISEKELAELKEELLKTQNLVLEQKQEIGRLQSQLTDIEISD